MNRFLIFLIALAASRTASAVVIRHDVDDARYRVPASALPALVDMPGEGHGVLVAPQWVLTAAHTLPLHGTLERVQLNGRPRAVAQVIVHPGYKALPQTLIDQAMATGEAILIVAFLSTSDDIALLTLAEPVSDVAPVARYLPEVRQGDTIEIIGKGATGNGVAGYRPGGPNRTELRRAYNEVTSAYDRWFCYRFDAPGSALPLEGALGNGDSGSPLRVQANGQWQLAGLASWKVVEGNVLTANYGVYGQVACNVRVGHYAGWIDEVMEGQAK